MKRRSFIKNLGGLSALAASSPMIIPSSALGKAGFVAPSNRVAMGSIGLGGMGISNTKNFLGDKRVQLVALCDVCKSNGNYSYNHNATNGVEAFSKKMKLNLPIYNDFRELLERDDLDAITTATPDHWHALIDIACANKGLDIYGEKPLTRTIEEGRALCDAVHRNGVIWQTGSWQRSRESFIYVAEMIRNGILGKVHKVKITLPLNSEIDAMPMQNVPDGFDWEMWQGPAKRSEYHPFKAFTTWRFVSEYSAGKVADWGAHHIDFSHWALGYNTQGPKKIKSVSTVWPSKGGFYDQPVEFRVEMEYENGEILDVSGAKGKPGIEFFGEKGSLYVDRSRMRSNPSILLDGKVPVDGKRVYATDVNHHKSFINSIYNRRAAVTDIEVAHRSNSACLLCEIAYKTGRTINWDWKNEKIIGDEEANRMLSKAYHGEWQLS